jgi:hypothetical protein
LEINYKYQVSVREFLKAAWAMGYPNAAVKGSNDHFVRGMTEKDFKDRVNHLDNLGRKGERQFNLSVYSLDEG